MNDSILQEVRDARAAVAADFDCDLHKFFAWATEHAVAERQAKRRLPTSLNKPSQPASEASVSSETPAV